MAVGPSGFGSVRFLGVVWRPGGASASLRCGWRAQHLSLRRPVGCRLLHECVRAEAHSRTLPSRRGLLPVGHAPPRNAVASGSRRHRTADTPRGQRRRVAIPAWLPDCDRCGTSRTASQSFMQDRRGSPIERRDRQVPEGTAASMLTLPDGRCPFMASSGQNGPGWREWCNGADGGQWCRRRV